VTVPQPVDSVNRPGNQQNWRSYLWVGILLSVVIIVLIGLALLLVPESTPAFDTAVDFMNSAGKGDDELASSRLSTELLDFVAENCSQGSLSACINEYTPPEWGGLIQAVFRRAIPTDEQGWDVLVVSTYEDAQGFSGVCSYFRVAPVEQAGDADVWQITRWAGFISCDEPEASLTALRDNPNAPNHAP
jgi:hypothetical protein